MRRYALALTAVAVALATSTQAGAAAAPKAATGALHVSGNAILDSNNKPVQLRGVQRDGTQGGPGTSSTPVTADELSWLGSGHSGSWKAGTVRVPVGAAQWTGLCPKLANNPTGYKASIDREVNTLTKAGITVILDLHSSTAGCSSIDRHAMPDGPVVTAFWKDAAKHYAKNPRVAFELYNEPHYVTDGVWLNGTSGATFQDCDHTVPLTDLAGQAAFLSCAAKAPKYQAVGMQALYDLVTGLAPGHLVIVDAPGYAASIPSVRVKATKGELAYGLHPYTCSNPGAACDTTAQAKANTSLLNAWKSFSATTPVLVTEFGWPTYAKGYGQGYVDGANYYKQSLAFFNAQAKKWGWIAFAWDGNTGGGFSLITNKTAYTPNSTGKPVYDALRAGH